MLLVDIQRKEPGVSGAAVKHLKSDSVLQSRRAVMDWASLAGFDVCFVVVHSGGDEHVQEHLSSTVAQEQLYFTVVVAGEALLSLIPALRSRPSLLTNYI